MTSAENRYGHFSDDGTEYIITRPDTPRPWINVLSNGDYGLTISQAGGGYSWRTHASLNRITRWSQDLIRDPWGKFLYIRDRDSGEYWSPTPQPAGGTLQDYQVRHGQGYSVFTGRSNDIVSRLTIFVPFEDPVEVWLLHLQNRGDGNRHLQIYSYLEWLLGAAPDWHREFHRTFIETGYDKPTGTLLATKVLWELPGESGPHWNRPWPYVAFHGVSHRVSGFETDKETFVGRNGCFSAPRSVRMGKLEGHQGRWGDPIGSLLVAIDLTADEEITLVYTLGAADDEDQALALAERYRSLTTATEALAEVKRFWRGVREDLEIETPDEGLNRMAQWLPYQTISGRLWGRSAYYQAGGAYGFRDQLQDSLVWLLLGRPDETLAQILTHAAHQFEEGIVLHWWHPLDETGLRSNYSDDLLWLPYVMLAYLAETANWDALDEMVPFYDHGEASLMQHCERAIDTALERRSERGLPLILEGDWNDGMNAVGGKRRGESVFVAHFLYDILRRWIDLPTVDEETRIRYVQEAEALRQAVNAHAWDGEWYWRATTDEGRLLGSRVSAEGRIFLNAQAWAVLSGMASRERGEMALESARRLLYKPYGPLLFTPAFTTPDSEIGYVTRYAPGVRENGGVYVHAACWAVLAERRLHGADAAYQLWRGFCPAHRGQEPDLYAGEPYVMPGNVHGPESPHSGRGAWTWYTGSAQWYLRALVEGVLGLNPTSDGLGVDAALPEAWDAFSIRRRFRGATYDIWVRRAGREEEPGIKVDGESYHGAILPLSEDPHEYRVEIVVKP
ncbi:MAG: GH36-type glycosyl hydrolase domain-containing protein [Anaerolineae bacterium]